MPLRDQNKPPIFASRTAFGRLDIKKGWMEAVRRAHFQDYRFHDLRHQFCTFAAKMGASNLELASAMGHLTLQRLTYNTFSELRKLLKKNGFATDKAISARLIQLYEQQNEELLSKITMLEQQKLENTAADDLTRVVAMLPQESNADKIMKYERSLQKSIFQNLLLLKKLQKIF